MRTSTALHTRQHTTGGTRCTLTGSTLRGSAGIALCGSVGIALCGSVGITRRISTGIALRTTTSTTLRGYAAGMVLPAPDGASHLSEMLTPPARAAPSLLASERRHARSVVPQPSVVLVVSQCGVAAQCRGEAMRSCDDR